MKKILFIDRDGTLIREAPPTYQIDTIDKLEFYPGVFSWLGKIARELDFTLVMVSNQDGLGTESFPLSVFQPIQDLIIRSFKNEGIIFEDILVDKTLPAQNANTRKPGTGLLTGYINDPAFDLLNSFVIGDRLTDVLLANNLGCKAIWFNPSADPNFSSKEKANTQLTELNMDNLCRGVGNDWMSVYEFLKLGQRKIEYQRDTNETWIRASLNLDGTGLSKINTGLNFFNHMLEQLSRHSSVDIELEVKGDLHVDEHHTMEDTGIALGESFAKALGDKKGIMRYGFMLPMDDCLAEVALDFGGRSWLVWRTEFKREKIGELPTEMFSHFFKSFCDGAQCNLNINAIGQNEHHKIEAIFKAVAMSIKMAIKRDPASKRLPTTKGKL